MGMEVLVEIWVMVSEVSSEGFDSLFVHLCPTGY